MSHHCQSARRPPRAFTNLGLTRRARKPLIAFMGAASAAAMTSGARAEELQRVDVNVSLAALHDTNVARSSSALAELRGLRREDTIITPVLQLDLLIPISRQAVFLNGSAGYDFYNHNQVLNNARADLRGGAQFAVRRCKGQASASYARRQSDLQQLSAAATKNVLEIATVGMDAYCGGAIGFGPSFSVEGSKADNSADQLRGSDYRSVRVSAGLAYRRPAFGEALLSESYTKTDYPNRVGAPGALPGDEGYELYVTSLRYTRKLPARLEATLEAGYAELDQESPLTPGFSGLTYTGAVEYRPSPRLDVRLRFQRAANPSDRFDATYSVDKIYSLDGNYLVNPRLQLSAGASYRSSRYQGVSQRPFVDVSSETVRAAYGSLQFRLSKRLAFALDLRREVRDADIAAYNYTDDQFGLKVTSTF
jgi:hypothetical protein